MISVKGKYQNGEIKLLSSIPKIKNNLDVIVTFLDVEEPSTINEKEFWSLIELLDWNQNLDSNILKPLIDKLSAFTIENIYQFKEILSEKLYYLDTKEHAKYIGEYSYKENNSDFSPDIFLFTRALVVAKGEDFYNRVLNNPKLIPKNSDFEAILYVPSDAYKIKTGKELNYVPKFIPETYFNKAGWNNEIDIKKIIFGE